LCHLQPWVAPAGRALRHAVHLYRSGWRLYPARPLVASPGSSTIAENLDVRAPRSPVRAAWLYHLNFTDRPEVQAFVRNRVPATADGRIRTGAPAPGPAANPPPHAAELNPVE